MVRRPRPRPTLHLYQIDREKMSKYDIEQHFFKKGYEYALLHFNSAVNELKIDKGLEKKILDEYMNFLKGDKNDNARN